MAKTQCERITEYVQQHGSINADQARAELGVRRLASRVYDLKTSMHPLKVSHIDPEGLAVYVPDVEKRTERLRGQVIVHVTLEKDPATLARALHRYSGRFGELALMEQR